MSVHKSLRTKAGLVRSRNVFTRWERIERLKEKGEWVEEKKPSVFGLRKVRTVLVKSGKKKVKKEKKEEGEAGKEGAAAPAAAPAGDKKK